MDLASARPAAGRCGTAAADARGGPPLGPKGRGDLWPDQPGYGNATGYRDLAAIYLAKHNGFKGGIVPRGG